MGGSGKLVSVSAPAVWKCAPHRGRVVRARVFTIINAAHEQKRGKKAFLCELMSAGAQRAVACVPASMEEGATQALSPHRHTKEIMRYRIWLHFFLELIHGGLQLVGAIELFTNHLANAL